MSQRLFVTTDVFNAAIDRMVSVYEAGHRVMIAFSGGKDSGVILEICKIAASITGRLPVEVWMLDDEAMFPGTFEYAERVAKQPDVKFHWAIAGEPMVATWNRECPYWWVFDNRLKPEEWMRIPPDNFEKTASLDMYDMVNSYVYPPKEGKDFVVVTGVRASESAQRCMSIHSTKGFLTAKDKWGTRKARPIYDWTDGDVWKAIKDNNWDYNHAYDVMAKMGIPKKKQRIAPPTMTFYGMELLQMAASAWPKWYEKLENRVPGARAIAYYGISAVQPVRRQNETWEECYRRECITNAPEWIAVRAAKAAEHMQKMHAADSNSPFPENVICNSCGQLGSWQSLGNLMYTGDAYSLKATFLPYIQPAVFRPDDTRVWKFKPNTGK